jgi:hypothetical protein
MPMPLSTAYACLAARYREQVVACLQIEGLACRPMALPLSFWPCFKPLLEDLVVALLESRWLCHFLFATFFLPLSFWPFLGCRLGLAGRCPLESSLFRPYYWLRATRSQWYCRSMLLSVRQRHAHLKYVVNRTLNFGVCVWFRDVFVGFGVWFMSKV